jgi:hypothetical protein
MISADETVTRDGVKTVDSNIVQDNLGANTGSEANGASKPDLLMSWLKTCGAKIDGLSVRNVTLDQKSQYGVFVDAELEPFSEVARIPLSCGISTASALEHPDLKQVWEAHPYLSEGRSPMAVQLLWERKLGSRSKYAQWLAMLPPSLDLPMMWSRSERKALKGSYTLDRVLADIEGLVEDYEKVFVRGIFKTHGEMFPAKDFTLDDYFWAWSIIWSRNIEQRVSGVWEAFLIPFVDMMNHNSAGGADLYVNFGKTDIVIRLNGSLAVGQELTRNYIPLAPNVELFRMYGFIDPHNPHIVSSLDFNLDKEDPYYSRRLNWAKRFKIDVSSDYPYNSLYFTNKGVPPNIPALLRIAHFNFETRETWSMIKDAPDPFKQIENSIEERFFTFLRQRLTKRLNQFPTTVQEDEALLARPDLPHRLQLAIEMRLEEKIAIQGSIDSLATTVVRFDEPIRLGRQRSILYPKRAASRESYE